MNQVLPRLDRDDARLRIERARGRALAYVSSQMPDLDAVVLLPTTGIRMPNETLFVLRTAVRKLAEANGYPDTSPSIPKFDGACARLIHEHLQISPHEASDREAWSYVTCCWLLDVAMWRYASEADEKRFIGDLNRNTFRRLWWRTETFGPDTDLTLFGEDELVAIMERPTLAGDKRLARTILSQFGERAATGEVNDRMFLMRETVKRLLRLTPFVSFGSLTEPELAAAVATAFDAAEAGIRGIEAPPARSSNAGFPPGVEVEQLSRGIGSSDLDPTHSQAEIARVALELASSTGRVTNTELRAVTRITPEDARAVLKELTDSGQLVRRGVKRGTHYLLAETQG